VHASFSVAWTDARATAPYTTGESLIKPASVKITRIMCSDAVSNSLAIVFLQTTPSSGASKTFRSIFWNKLLLLRIEAKWNFQRWARRETTDVGNEAQFMVFVRYRATEDYVQQSLFCCPLAKHTTRK